MSRHAHALVFALGCAAALSACVHATRASPPPITSAEQAAAAYLASIQDQPSLLLAFMRELPKGGDLHNHLSGAIYAEHFIDWAAHDGRCIDRGTMKVVPPPCDPPRGVPAADALHDTALYRRAIDAWSMRDFVPSAGSSGHDHFFATFGKFSLADDGHRGDELTFVVQRAASEHVLYLELMVTPASRPTLALLRHVDPAGTRSSSDSAADFTPASLARLRDQLVPVMPAVVAAASAALDTAERTMRATLHCGTPAADAGCDVQVRYLDQVPRSAPPRDVFAQLVLGFEMASRDPRVVGFNMVAPEDGPVSMRDFRLHMAMLDVLHRIYPAVHVTLHAGELAPAIAPPEGLRFHIRASIEQGHAERIGHGVDLMHEDDHFGLLREMAERHVLVEICLTSNATILGVAGGDHPLETYLRAHVPVALATDDAGVSRSSLSQEFVRAEQAYHLSYSTLEAMIRASLEHAFLPGASLWQASDQYDVVSQCSADAPGAPNPSPACAGFLAQSPKAALQWREEGELRAFENVIAGRR